MLRFPLHSTIGTLILAANSVVIVDLAHIPVPATVHLTPAAAVTRACLTSLGGELPMLVPTPHLNFEAVTQFSSGSLDSCRTLYS